ncbi:hypothetical protein TUM4637_03730 [Shewanella hafniensis]|nr:hypothetical protein TUM4637_03730 [Shewanella hafniensis]
MEESTNAAPVKTVCGPNTAAKSGVIGETLPVLDGLKAGRSVLLVPIEELVGVKISAAILLVTLRLGLVVDKAFAPRLVPIVLVIDDNAGVDTGVAICLPRIPEMDLGPVNKLKLASACKLARSFNPLT